LLEEIEKYNLLKNGGDILKEGYLIYF
jgi:hypothetical protein